MARGKYRQTFTFEGRRYDVTANSESALSVKVAMRKRDLEEQKRTVTGNTLFKDWAETWLEIYKRPAVKDITYRTIRGVVRTNLIPAIGQLQLKSIKPVHCQNVLNELSGSGAYHLKRVHGIMRQVFEAACDNQLVASNPADKLAIPKAPAGTHRAITDGERALVLQTAKDHPRGVWILTMLYCGLRPQETTQLKGMNIDWERRIMHVPGTKNKNAVRDVPIPSALLEVLPRGNPFDYIFKSEQGHPLNSSIMARWWKSFKMKMNIEAGCKVYRNQVVPPYRVAEDLTPYCLRHTYCTDLQAAGVPINVAKELMGHSDISLTARIYTHKSDAAFNRAADLIEQYQRGTTCGTESAKAWK